MGAITEPLSREEEVYLQTLAESVGALIRVWQTNAPSERLFSLVLGAVNAALVRTLFDQRVETDPLAIELEQEARDNVSVCFAAERQNALEEARAREEEDPNDD